LLTSQDKLSHTLTINEDGNKEFYIKHAIEEIIQSKEDILDQLERGEGYSSISPHLFP
jgi:hypothetical protein